MIRSIALALALLSSSLQAQSICIGAAGEFQSGVYESWDGAVLDMSAGRNTLTVQLSTKGTGDLRGSTSIKDNRSAAQVDLFRSGEASPAGLLIVCALESLPSDPHVIGEVFVPDSYFSGAVLWRLSGQGSASDE